MHDNYSEETVTFYLRQFVEVFLAHLLVYRRSAVYNLSYRPNNTFFIKSVLIALLGLRGMMDKLIGKTQTLYPNACYILFG